MNGEQLNNALTLATVQGVRIGVVHTRRNERSVKLTMRRGAVWVKAEAPYALIEDPELFSQWVNNLFNATERRLRGVTVRDIRPGAIRVDGPRGYGLIENEEGGYVARLAVTSRAPGAQYAPKPRGWKHLGRFPTLLDARVALEALIS